LRPLASASRARIAACAESAARMCGRSDKSAGCSRRARAPDHGMPPALGSISRSAAA